MQYYNKIPIWENKRRLQLLIRYRQLMSTYFDNIEHLRMASGIIENKEAKDARVQVNRILDEVDIVINLAGVSTIIKYTPPPIVGGYIERIDVVLNVFGMHRYHIQPDDLLGFVDRAIGIYENDSPRAWIRTFNPIYWIGYLFDFIAGLPFALLGRIGFDKNRAESSIIGRAIKAILYLVEVFAALLAILHFLGYLEEFKALFGKVLKWN